MDLQSTPGNGRPYKKALYPKTIAAELKRWAEKQFDLELEDSFLQVLDEGILKSFNEWVGGCLLLLTFLFKLAGWSCLINRLKKVYIGDQQRRNCRPIADHFIKNNMIQQERVNII